MGNYLPFPFDGSYTPHPNSLMFNVYPIFWPCKIYWMTGKVRKNPLFMNNFYLSITVVPRNCYSLRFPYTTCRSRRRG